MCIESRALDRDSFGYLEHWRVIGRRERGEDRSGRFAMLELPIPNEIRSRRLKERHLVDSRPHPGDARRTLLSLTTEGQRTVAKLLVNGPAVSRETLKPLSNQEQRQLLELLSKII